MSKPTFLDRIRQKFNLPQSNTDSEGGTIKPSEKTVVFVLSFIIALGLWLLINLGQDYAVTLQLPLNYGTFPENQAPVQPLPDYTNATFSGQGWKLLTLYGNPPRVTVNLESASTNIFDAIQSQITPGQNLSLNRAEPAVVDVEMEEAVTRKVPVQSNISLNFRSQYGTIGTPSMRPDSIRVMGARSLIQNIEYWPTTQTAFEDINQSFTAYVDLEESNELVRISHNQVQIEAEVVEFTEGEVRIPVEVEGQEGKPRVILNPANITLRYNIPVGQYVTAQQRNAPLFRAVVDYSDIEQDTTGYVVPEFIIQDSEFEINVRSYSPRRLSYFRVIEE